MREIDALINFLEKKAWSSNRTLQASGIDYHHYRNMMSRPKLIEKASDSLIQILDRQILINEIIAILNDLAFIKKRNCEQGIDCAELEIHNYFNVLISSITDGRRNFDKSHPLYGFLPFHVKLFKHYIDNEEYELCSKLKKEMEQINLEKATV